jgi:hypothetical protein
MDHGKRCENCGVIVVYEEGEKPPKCCSVECVEEGGAA